MKILGWVLLSIYLSYFGVKNLRGNGKLKVRGVEAGGRAAGGPTTVAGDAASQVWS